MGKITLLIGGARSGKSTYAESLIRDQSGQVVYLATAEGLDQEMKDRIEKHRQVRPGHWHTLEVPWGLGEALHSSGLEPELVLLDCVTLLVSNLVLEAGGSEERPDQDRAEQAVEAEIASLIQAMTTSSAAWVVVTNEVGLGLVPPYPLGRLYRDLLGRANRKLAGVSDEVYFLTAGMALPLHELGFRIDG